ncbi:MAG: leucyl/phenylalanyl-tRNA--protein transferase [Acidobacteria bacterium]|nr:MAG: leucyl/phenylalanyl-tRNA--protein transferase [Acidobacteriota bacterium]
MSVFRIGKELVFPSPDLADEDGLLGIGGDLSPMRLLSAYQSGIFPWFNDDSPILWWSPDPRFVLFPRELKVRRSLAKIIRSKRFRVTFDTAFKDVIWQCSRVPRRGQEGTWITDEMRTAYTALHQMGWAHSCEVWIGHQLVGGLYGVCMGSFFFGESMFHKESNASQVALVALCDRLKKATLIDCQIETPHFRRMGARFIARSEFLSLLSEHLLDPVVWDPSQSSEW